MPGRLQEITVTHNYMLGRPGHFRLTPDGKTVLFLRAEAEDARSDLWAKDVASGDERRLVAADSLLGGEPEKLSAEEKAMRERKRIKTRGFTGYALSRDGRRVVLELSGQVFLYDLASSSVARLELGKGAVVDPRLSPDGKRLAFVRDHDLHVMKLGKVQPTKKRRPDIIRGRIRALTKGGEAKRSHGLAEFVAAEEMSRYRGFWWAPDGKSLVYQSTDERHLEAFTIANAARPEQAAQVFGYPRPGKANAKVRLHIVGVDGKRRREIKWDRGEYPYLARVTWPSQGPLSLLVQARDQRSQVFLTADPKSGETAPLLSETDEAWLNLTSSTPRWAADGGSFYWAHEAPGQWVLERHFVEGRGAKAKITKTVRVLDDKAGYRRIAAIDDARGWLWFLGGDDPVQTQLLRAPLAGGEVEQVTTEAAEHAAVFSADGSTFVLTTSTFQSPARSEVWDVEGLKVPLPPDARAPATRQVSSAALSPGIRPRLERVPPERAGGFHALVVRPQDFDPDKRYPVILYVYGGPHHNTVVANVTRYHLHQWMADHGFVVVCLDGRGTMFRGRDFERALLGKFGEVPLDDQVAGLTALGEHYPELDLDRVGVYGWSFGGYLSALAVLRRPDIFKVAVAGAPVVDWMYYDTHYTERYLGLPGQAKDAYASSSLLTYASELSRPLLLVHGIADDNVYFAHTLQLADALFRARKDFDLLPLVGLTHQVSDPKVREALYDRMVRFLGASLW